MLNLLQSLIHSVECATKTSNKYSVWKELKCQDVCKKMKLNLKHKNARSARSFNIVGKTRVCNCKHFGTDEKLTDVLLEFTEHCNNFLF